MLPRKPLDRLRLQGPLCAVLGHEDGSDAASTARAQKLSYCHTSEPFEQLASHGQRRLPCAHLVLRGQVAISRDGVVVQTGCIGHVHARNNHSNTGVVDESIIVGPIISRPHRFIVDHVPVKQNDFGLAEDCTQGTLPVAAHDQNHLALQHNETQSHARSGDAFELASPSHDHARATKEALLGAASWMDATTTTTIALRHCFDVLWVSARDPSAARVPGNLNLVMPRVLVVDEILT